MVDRAEMRKVLGNLPELETLSDAELVVFQQCLDELAVDGKSPLAASLLLTDYKWEPVTIERFLEEPYYAGDLTKDLFPACRGVLIETFDTGRRPTELVLAGSTGWGKTTILALSCLYMAYRLTCLRDPHDYYGLMKGAPIVLGLYSVNLDQAYDTVYGKVLNWVDTVPYFSEKAPRVKRLTSKIKFAQSPVEIIAGSKELHSLGKDLFFAGIDEANFMTSANGEIDEGVAAAIYTSVSRRLKSRFMTSTGEPAGMAVISSSKRTKASFVENHLRENAADVATGLIKVAAFSQWGVRPPSKYTKPKFRVQVGDRIHPARILLEGEDSRPGTEVITVPGEYRRDFEQDIDKALRDIAGVASEAMVPLLHDKSCIARCEALTAHVHPFTREVITISTDDDVGIEAYLRPEIMFKIVRSAYRMRINPEAARYVHVDTAFTGDCLGISMVHIAGFKSVKRTRKDGTWYEDRAPIVVVDFMLQVKPPQVGEIDLSKVRAFICCLRDYGVPIWRVTYDGHQSRDSMQIMRKLGFDALLYSVDRTDEAYLSLKQALMEERIQMYHYPEFVREVSELERDLEKGKVDHPRVSSSTGKPGSKDVSDSVAGAVFNALVDKRQAVTGVVRTSPPGQDNVATRVAIPGGTMLWSDLEKEVRS
jgi:hypothetical protein